MKEIKDETNREIYPVFGLEKLILWKWLYSPNPSTESMQSSWNYQWYFSQENGNLKNLYGNPHTKAWITKESWESKTELEISGSLILDYTTKLQSSKWYGIGTKTEIYLNGTC